MLSLLTPEKQLGLVAALRSGDAAHRTPFFNILLG